MHAANGKLKRIAVIIEHLLVGSVFGHKENTCDTLALQHGIQ